MIDLSVLPIGQRYEDTYGLWLEIFKEVALEPQEVKQPPVSWIPLLRYMGATTSGHSLHFDHDLMLLPMIQTALRFDRTAVEVLCGFRPECVDALWKYDMEWGTRVPNEGKREFIVTCNGSYYRREILNYLNTLASYNTTCTHAVLVPCAADKPYPSKLHKTVKDMLPPHYGLYVATGVLGIVPEGLWPVAPYYDSGIPNQWRLYNIAKDFFTRNAHTRVICYTDFYSYTLREAIADVVPELLFVDQPVERNGYLDLLDTARLEKLKALL